MENENKNNETLILPIETILFYYDVPQLLICASEKTAFLFVMLDEEKLQYIGKPITPGERAEFLTGGIDLRSLYLASDKPFYIGEYSGNKLACRQFTGDITEDFLPEEGLICPAQENI